MKIKFLKTLDFTADKDKLKDMKKKVDEFLKILRKTISKRKVKAKVFVGGSYAKGTLIKSKEYDIDIFVRFEKGEEISTELEKILSEKEIKKLGLEKIHGSRDYFRIYQEDIIFEIIPVKKISNPKKMENVTDLSYFHVNYLKKKLKDKKLTREIALAKTFCKAAGIYGAESYINGFSGYGLECLIIYYRSFEKMISEILKAKGKIIIDPEKYYKKKEHIKVEVNESKLQSPIVLIDPTWKSRNVLAALSEESLEKFKKAASEFRIKPSIEFFEKKGISLEEMKNIAEKEKAEFVEIRIETDRQEGDIGGTKLKKFSKLLTSEIEEYFEVIRTEFKYDEKHEASLFLIAKNKEEVVKKGPPVNFEKFAGEFKKIHKEVFEKEGWLFAREKVDFSLKEFVNNYAKKNSDKLKEMDITGLFA